MSSKQEIHIIGGGTVYHVRPHLALSAPAYGNTAKTLKRILASMGYGDAKLHLTKMAGGDKLETNEDVANLVDELIEDPASKLVFMNAALCDFTGYIRDTYEDFPNPPPGKMRERLSSKYHYALILDPAEKVLRRIRKERKDIFLVAFKTTAGATPEKQFEAGMRLLKKNSCNLVLANDVHTRHNMILTPEMASYGNTSDRFEVIHELAEMAVARSSNSFVRTNVIDEKPLPWSMTPKTLRDVVEHCVAQGAYEAFDGTTVGHFGYLPKDPIWGNGLDLILSSRRKQNYNIPGGLDLAQVYFLEDGTVQSKGGKPSAGVRSQFELLKKHDQFDCVVHFHCPMKDNSKVATRPQKMFECGSLDCGQNTSNGVVLFENGEIGAVMLEKHGPNILFKSNGDAHTVIKFIEENFDLSKRAR